MFASLFNKNQCYPVNMSFMCPVDIQFVVKKFEDFTLHELYAVLRLRSEVFVLEQTSIFQDLDAKD